MDSPSMESYLTGRQAQPPQPPKQATAARSFIPEGLKTALILALVAIVGYQMYDGYRFQLNVTTDLKVLRDHIQNLEESGRAGEAKLTSLRSEVSQAQKAVGTARAEVLRRAEQQIQLETSKTKAEMNMALSSKADTSQVQALKQEADSKITQVTSEVGGVKTEVGAVKSDLAGAKRDLEGTQRQLLDVKETLSAAIAKNSSELAELRRKGERDYVEFEINKKNTPVKVEDISLVLKGTDAKKGKYTMQIIVDDNRLEKRDRTINEPVQFLVGRNRVRYEVVVNWVQKDRAGGYLAIPKDKNLSAERAAQAAKK